MTPPGFRAERFRVHADWKDAYLEIRAAAERGTKPQAGIWKRFEAARRRLEADPQWGEVIRQHQIPAYFQDRYGCQNLYCIDLKGDVRCFYTIDERDVIFLDIVDHGQYDRWFPPKGRQPRRP